MNKAILNFNDDKGTSSVMLLDTNPLLLKVVDENDNILHLFEMVEGGQYFEIPVIDTNKDSTQTRWKKYKSEFRKS